MGAALPGVGLAPMEGVTDFATRLWFSLTSRPASVATPFLRVTPNFPFRAVSPLFIPELASLKGSHRYRLIPQLMASDADEFARIAEPILAYTPFVDLNCGCPAPTVVGNGAGSSILRSVDRFHQFVSHICQRLGPQKLSVKMRLGFTNDAEFEHLVAGIVDLPLAQLQVHGRTRSDRYSGKARWSPIAEVAKRASFQVVASGDIQSRADLERQHQLHPHISRVIIGRGALRQPWVFAEIRSGEPTKVSASTVFRALTTFALLQNLQIAQPTKMLDFGARLGSMPVLGTDADAWERVLGDLLQVYAVTRTDQIEPHPYTVGRTKMLWNFMRSSFPAEAFAPQVFRAKNLHDFLTGVEAVLSGVDTDAGIPLRTRSELDWLYAGGKEKEEISSRAGN